MKIAYFIDHLRGDGTQHMLVQLVRGLSARGHAQNIFCLNRSYDAHILEALQNAGASVQIIGTPALLSGRGLAMMWRALRRSGADVVVTLLFFGDVLGRTLAHWARVPHIVTSIRARNVNYARWMLFLSRATMRWADAVILNSATVAEFASAREGAARDKIHIIPNGIDVRAYQQPVTRDALRHEFGFAPSCRIVGSVGRLTRQKGYDVLLDALAQLPVPRPALLLVGEGEERGALEARARVFGLQVCFAGYRRDVAQLLGALDVYVQPSRFEGMPNALLEAMAAGCACVATDADGTRELITDNVQGWLVPPENANALADAITRVLCAPHDAARCGTAARQRAMDEFGLDVMVSAWERVLQNG